MTLAALMLLPTMFRPEIPERAKYGALGVLFVNISIGGTLTSFAAPPVLMVAATWNWDSAFMVETFGWRAVTAVLINATVCCWVLRRHLTVAPPQADRGAPVPLIVALVHFAFLAGVVLLAHHPVLFLGLFLFFLGYTQAYSRHQSPLILKEGLLVGFFLAGLVVLGPRPANAAGMVASRTLRAPVGATPGTDAGHVEAFATAGRRSGSAPGGGVKE